MTSKRDRTDRRDLLELQVCPESKDSPEISEGRALLARPDNLGPLDPKDKRESKAAKDLSVPLANRDLKDRPETEAFQAYLGPSARQALVDSEDRPYVDVFFIFESEN